MTELGMALTNPLQAKDRKPGFVGMPFPGVRVRIVKEGNLFCFIIVKYYALVQVPKPVPQKSKKDEAEILQKIIGSPKPKAPKKQ